jgi:hypothetical protein
MRRKVIVSVSASLAALGILTSCAKFEMPTFTSAEVHHSPEQIPIHTDPRLAELRALLANQPGNWSRVENGPSRAGVMIVLRNGPEVVANLYVGKDWIGFKEAGERGPPMSAPSFEKPLLPGVADRILNLFSP